MAGASAGFHEDPSLLKAETADFHRALVSLMEELEAIDWYAQRIDAAKDDELRAILAHNRDEEKEHAAMLLEWLRRKDAVFDEHLRAYLFTEKPILALEESAEATEPRGNRSLGIGSLKEESEDE